MTAVANLIHIILSTPAIIGGLGGGEILVIVLVILLLFGPRDLPDMVRNIASALRKVRRAGEEIRTEIGLDEMIASARAPLADWSAPPSRQKRAVTSREGVPAEGQGVSRAPDPPAAVPPSDRPAKME
jgi:sec-independent protein translocase protein TatA